MFKKSFPKCEVEGSYDPIPYGHLGLKGSIPRKCGDCKNLFEGECLRAFNEAKGYLYLDYGPCSIKGNTEPIIVTESKNGEKLHVPFKCVKCNNLMKDKIIGFFVI